MDEYRPLITITNINNLNSDYVKNELGENKDIDITFKFKQYDDYLCSKIISLINELMNDKYTLHLYIDSTFLNFDKDSINNIKGIEKSINEKFSIIGGIKKDYTIEEYEEADKKLDALISEINNHDFSPLEKFLYIYHYTASKNYVETIDHTSRDLISIMNGDKLVCTGYANIISYLCKEVGIEAFNQHVIVKGKDGIDVHHENNLVYINDDKYDIHGLYYVDATWDRGNDGKNITYAFSLLSLENFHRMNIQMSHYGDEFMFYEDQDLSIIANEETIGLRFGIIFNMDGPQYSNLLMHYHLEERYESLFQQYLEVINTKNDEFLDAVEELKTLFEKYKDDLYESENHFLYPSATSPEYLLSLIYLGYKEKAKEQFDILLNYLEEGKDLDEGCGVHYYVPSLSGFFLNIDGEYLSAIIADYMTAITIYYELQDIIKDMNIGTVIEEDKYINALSRVYEVLGIEDELDNDISRTRNYARKAFNDLSLITFK